MCIRDRTCHDLGAIVGHFEAYAVTKVALWELALNFGAQILHFFFINERCV